MTVSLKYPFGYDAVLVNVSRRTCHWLRLSPLTMSTQVDVIGSAMVTVAAVATGFVPAPLHAVAPLAWPLVVASPGGRALLASRLPQHTCVPSVAASLTTRRS